MNKIKVAAAVLLSAIPLLQGCKVSASGNASVTCGGGKPCTVTTGGGITVSNQAVGIQINNQATGLTPDMLTAAPNSNYSVIVHVPSNAISYNESSNPQATLQATTDTGYASNVVVDLTPTGSSPSSLYNGYTAYSFAIQPSAALTNWINSVNSHTTSTSDITTVSSAAFTQTGAEGNYTIYAQFSSTQTGTVDSGSATYYYSGGGKVINPCKPGMVCNQ